MPLLFWVVWSILMFGAGWWFNYEYGATWREEG